MKYLVTGSSGFIGKIFEAIHQENQRLKKTVFDNMRIE